MKRLGVKFYDDSDIEYRGETSSGKLKTILDSLKQSVLRAYVRGQRTAREIDDLSKAVYYQNVSINNAFKNVHFDKHVQNQVGSDRVVWRNFYDGNVNILGTIPSEGEASSNVVVESKFGQMVLKQNSKLSKIKTITDSLGVKHPSSSTKIYIGDGDVASPTTQEIVDRDDAAYNILDGDGKTFWIEDKLAYDKLALDLTFAPSLTTRANVITIEPFPFHIVSIDSIQYKPLTNNTFREIPFPDLEGFPALDRAPMRIHFNPVDYGDEIRIIMSPTLAGLASDPKIVYGLSDLNLEFVEYASSGYAYDDLQIPEVDDSKTIANITSFTPYYTLDLADEEFENAATLPIKFQLMTTAGTVVYDSEENGPLTTDDTPVSGLSGEDTIRVKTIMNNVGNVTPMLRGYSITYTIQ